MGKPHRTTVATGASNAPEPAVKAAFGAVTCFVRSGAVVVAFLWLAIGSPSLLAQTMPPSAVPPEIHALLQHDPAVIAGEAISITEVRRVYEPRGYLPIWHSAALNDIREVETRLFGAVEHGLNPGDLHLPPLSRRQNVEVARNVAERDVLLTDAVLRYAGKLRQGSVSPNAFGKDWSIGPDPFSPAEALLAALRGPSLRTWLDSLEPPHPQYRRLIAALRHHHHIVDGGGWPRLPGGEELRLDEHDPRIDALRTRLQLEGDLSSSDALHPAALMDAVRRFQSRHGLAPDGRIGPRTLMELGASAEQRVAQIAVNLERWRRLPRDLGDTHVAVNVAGAVLTFVEGGKPTFETRVIVGDRRHPTPVLSARIDSVTVNPLWNIPHSIATREILPRLRRDPGYLQANNIIILDRPADPFGIGIDWRAIAARNFPYRLQQLPGKKNALGGIKFEMPNKFSVYLHDTPGKALFERTERGFSHGCVRVERPAELAARLLNTSDWNAPRIDSVIAEGETRRLPLIRQVPVHLLYWTAFVDDTGRTNFRPDLYRRDPPLEHALGFGQEPRHNITARAEPIGCPGAG